MSALSAINYLFLNRNFGAVPAGEPFHNCIIIPVFSGSFTDSFAKVHFFNEFSFKSRVTLSFVSISKIRVPIAYISHFHTGTTGIPSSVPSSS